VPVSKDQKGRAETFVNNVLKGGRRGKSLNLSYSLCWEGDSYGIGHLQKVRSTGECASVQREADASPGG